MSIIPRGDHARAYFGNDALTPAERGCIAAAVKPLTDLPANGQYRIRVDAAGLAVSLRP
ncbi:MAG: hypothetical protein HS111_16475 [Kofleriaceae bacterium]|nr:hypothetical protein [Kofleriaceae bacterium]